MAYEIIAGRGSKERERFGLDGTIFIGKNYVQFGKDISLANPIHLDIANPHVILVAGKRGSGKSYTLSTIAEGMLDLPKEIGKNISTIIFDTLGIFWTMKYPNYRDDAILREWNLTPKNYSPIIYVPFGLFKTYQEKGIPVDLPFALKPNEVSAESWAEMFNIDLISGEGTLIERAVDAANITLGDYEIDDLIELSNQDHKSTDKERNVIENRFGAAKKWGIFNKSGTKISQLFKGGTNTIIDLSAYSQVEGGHRIKALVIGLLSKKILQQRMLARKTEEINLISSGGFLLGKELASTGEDAPMIWIMIDEAHEFIPHEDQAKTLATEPLMQLLREGRQPGISVVLATQQPGKIHTDVMTQADIVISHKITSKIDIDALNLIASTYLPKAIQFYVDSLPTTKGSAILIDDKLERIYPIQIKPKASWHGGSDPTAVREHLRAFKLTY
ncbi:MAG: ATP-binding protein [DPANN group archaeon]|nr:ATP-binding protein [DPANN group archaeon]